MFPIVEMRAITKRYGDLLANDGIAVIYRGRIVGDRIRSAFDMEALGKMMTGAE